ncbi:hypothetical protein RJ639_047839 [Escallonia herrerae]|uniref:NAC domain-containing protein n=1 Tax=Escallonia herrerae TaxID=1293975 RepID=A0AA88W6V6_9ASTE|nr:hypothetical protein RJ639_047839 [Escallonia herrerae]
MGLPDKDPLSQLSLPPGFRFFPTDEELLVQYLCRKVAGHHFSLEIIAEIDLYKFDPWVLPVNVFRSKTSIKMSLKLDDWVLCRIYKKNSSAQKSMMGAPASSKEYSHGSSSSCSSQFDDMLESLPEIDDRAFTLPHMNSLMAFQQDDKLNLQKLGSGNFDWASLAALSSMPDPVPGSQASQTQGHVTNHNNGQNDIYVPSMPAGHVDSRFGRTVDEEVQSGLRANSGYFQRGSNAFAQSYSNSVDPFAIRYPSQQGSLGLRQ